MLPNRCLYSDLLQLWKAFPASDVPPRWYDLQHGEVLVELELSLYIFGERQAPLFLGRLQDLAELWLTAGHDVHRPPLPRCTGPKSGASKSATGSAEETHVHLAMLMPSLQVYQTSWAGSHTDTWLPASHFAHFGKCEMSTGTLSGPIEICLHDDVIKNAELEGHINSRHHIWIDGVRPSTLGSHILCQGGPSREAI